MESLSIVQLLSKLRPESTYPFFTHCRSCIFAVLRIYSRIRHIGRCMPLPSIDDSESVGAPHFTLEHSDPSPYTTWRSMISGIFLTPGHSWYREV